MKKYTCISQPKHVLEITLLMSPEEYDVAASNRVSHPTNVAKKFLWSDQQLADFNALVETVCSVIEHFHFDIIDEGQSGKSYAYYIDFFPTDGDGIRWDETVEIKFRLADHSNKGADNQEANIKNKGKNLSSYTADRPRTYVKSFVIGSTQYPGQFAVMQAVTSICEGLSEGNYNILDEY